MQTVPTESLMLRLFREGAECYQPAGPVADLAAEHVGRPETADENIHRLLRSGLVISQIHVRPTGTLFLFSTGEQYYTPALRVGGDGRETEALAEIAAESGWGDLVELLDHFHATPREWIGPLPALTADARLPR